MINSHQNQNLAACPRAGSFLGLLLLAGLLLSAACSASGQAIKQRLYSFGLPGASEPDGALIQGSDGALYGTTTQGGTNGAGAVFRIGVNGIGFAELYSFTNTGDYEVNPGDLIQGADGALYGTTSGGGTNGYGTVFRMGADGSGYAILYNFGAFGGDGQAPYAGLIQATNGALYGTTYYGGTNDDGAIFRIGTNGAGYAVLHNFTGAVSDGATPYARLIQGADGALYGTTTSGGSNFDGTVFRISASGASYTVLHSFMGAPNDGAEPAARLLQGADGALYGVTDYGGPYGGPYGIGTVFRIGVNGSGYAALYIFTGTGGDGAYPYGGLIQGADGLLHGMTTYGGTNNYGTVFQIGTNGSNYAALFSFTGAGGDGASPNGVIQGVDGTLYGTTTSGGTNGYGTIFQMGVNGTGYAVLYNFDYTSGYSPYTGVIQGADGALYGTTYEGGTNVGGTVFRMGIDGSGFSVLHNFNFNEMSGDGFSPDAAVIQGADGALYGTTDGGGTNDNGTVFRIGADGSGYAILYSFTGTSAYDASPNGLIQGADGALYGTTEGGGTYDNGAVFRIGADGTGYTVLYSFTGTGGDGTSPNGLIQAADGALYGTTSGGGTYDDGTVFRISTDGTGYAILHSFTGTGGDGSSPNPVIQGADGALYGTTYYGGTTNSNGPYAPSGNGTAFKLNTNGTGYQLLYSFTGASGGETGPWALIQGADGAFYGAAGGGNLDDGTVFRLVPWPVGAGVLQISNAPGQGAQLSFVPPLNSPSAISVSSDLLNWMLLTNLPASLGPVYFKDVSATNFAHRFYRACWTQ